jgi:hypothetical protein
MGNEPTGVDAGPVTLVQVLSNRMVAIRPVVREALARRQWEIEHPEPVHVRHDAAS